MVLLISKIDPVPWTDLTGYIAALLGYRPDVKVLNQKDLLNMHWKIIDMQEKSGWILGEQGSLNQ